MSSRKQELYALLSSSNCLSQIQLAVLWKRINNESYLQIQHEFSFSCPNLVQNCIFFFFLGRYWEPGGHGGRNPYLGEIDFLIFKKKIDDECDNLNCIPTGVACAIAHQLATERVRFANELLILIKYIKIASKLSEPDPPSKTWLKSVCSQFGIRIVKPQELELIRRLACDVMSVYSFFENNFDILDRDPRLIFNMDETMISAKKNSKF